MNPAVLVRCLVCIALLGVHRLAVAEPAALFGDYQAWGVARFAVAADPSRELESEGVNVYVGEGEVPGRRIRGTDAPTGAGPASERLTVTSLRLAWGHMLAAHEQLHFSAQYDDVSDERMQARAASNYFAAVGWRGAYATAGRAHIGGSVYIGEESVDRSADAFGRRYFGVSADGSYTLFKDHSPFLSLRLQRSDYDDTSAGVGTGGAGPLLRGSEEFSQFAAGWDWQVYPSWHVRAQAEYALNKSDLLLYEYDANRLFFSTRFDFR